MYKILILSGKSLFGGAQAAAIAEYIKFEDTPNLIISSNVGNINNIILNRPHNTIYDIEEDLLNFWNKDYDRFYFSKNDKLYIKSIFRDLISSKEINPIVNSHMIICDTGIPLLTYDHIIIGSSINIPNIIDFEDEETYGYSYQIENLTKIMNPIYVKERIDPINDKIEITVIYNSWDFSFIQYPTKPIDKLLYSMNNESNELYHITRFFSPNKVNIIKVPTFYNTDVPSYNNELYIKTGKEQYLKSINY